MNVKEKIDTIEYMKVMLQFDYGYLGLCGIVSKIVGVGWEEKIPELYNLIVNVGQELSDQHSCGLLRLFGLTKRYSMGDYWNIPLGENGREFRIKKLNELKYELEQIEQEDC